MEKDINTTIVIVSYNTNKVTEDCLQSIYSACWRRPFEGVVVDNNSNDGSVEMIKSKFPQVKLIENKYNALFAKANNQGAKIANGKYLLLLNSDTIVEGDNLERLTEYFDSLPENVICVGPRILNPDNSLQSCGYANPGYRERFMMCSRLFRIFPSWLNQLIVKGLPADKSRTCGWVSGCCMLMRKDLYDKAGGLNENLVFYGEEPEFGWRTSKLGYKTLYWTGAEIVHLGGVSTKKSETKKENREESFKRYAALQKETVGYKKAIRMSEIVNVFARLKMLIPFARQHYKNALAYEKELIGYLHDISIDKIQ